MAALTLIVIGFVALIVARRSRVVGRRCTDEVPSPRVGAIRIEHNTDCQEMRT